ncbi:MAG: helix-turn-helix domain-containing protein [Candidatus Gracilibacteria bacterium]
MDTHNTLKQLGFSEIESIVYLSLLQSGGDYVSTLAKRTKQGRVGLYYTLDILVQKKLVTVVKRHGAKFFIPEKPERIVNIERERLNLSEMILPSLKTLVHAEAFRPAFTLLDEKDDIDTFLDELTHSEEVLSYANMTVWYKADKDRLLKFLERILKKTKKTQLILPYHEETQTLFRHLAKKYSHLSLVTIEEGQFPFRYDIFITENVVGLFFFEDGEFRAIRIASREYADSQRAIFYLAWLGATGFVTS